MSTAADVVAAIVRLAATMERRDTREEKRHDDIMERLREIRDLVVDDIASRQLMIETLATKNRHDARDAMASGLIGIEHGLRQLNERRLPVLLSTDVVHVAPALAAGGETASGDRQAPPPTVEARVGSAVLAYLPTAAKWVAGLGFGGAVGWAARHFWHP